VSVKLVTGSTAWECSVCEACKGKDIWECSVRHVFDIWEKRRRGKSDFGSQEKERVLQGCKCFHNGPPNGCASFL
jgi:hypothetical protein